MSYCAELVTFRLTVPAEEFLELRDAAIKQVKAAHPGLVAVPFCGERADGSWIDVWIYESVDAADTANADAGSLSDFLGMAKVLTDVDVETTMCAPRTVTPMA
ncbi:hypothetical protein [Mycobacterium kyogaense]|uniref:hypothetical protein n=1 Tax=Mycobacterium kyogaense TaxID=2212479 RepID=UPI000DAE1CC8|nr:hypothetical protein [Mycobacterium kyogaense]